MISSNLNDGIRKLALDGVDACAIAEHYGISESDVVVVLAARKATRSKDVLAKLEDMGEDAVRVIRDIMDDPDVHPIVRLRAATYVTDVATGIKSPVTHVLPDNPAGLSDTFKAFMETYTDSIKRVTEAPAGNSGAYKQLIDV